MNLREKSEQNSENRAIFGEKAAFRWHKNSTTSFQNSHICRKLQIVFRNPLPRFPEKRYTYTVQ